MRFSLALGPSLVLVLASCGGTVVFEEDGGEGGASGNTTGSPTVGGGSPTSSVASTGQVATVVGTTSPAVSVTSSDGSGICGTNVTLLDGTEDTCLGDACCDFFSSCAANGTAACQACLDAGGGFECDDALKCSRDAACYAGFEECQSGLETGDPGVDQCLVDFCCFDAMVCTQAGADLEGCYQCFEQGGGPRCNGLFVCAEDNCDGGGGGGPGDGICDTGLSTSDPRIDQCLGDFCCDTLHECLDGGQDACLECLNNGKGGPLCDQTIACFQESCGFDSAG